MRTFFRSTILASFVMILVQSSFWITRRFLLPLRLLVLDWKSGLLVMIAVKRYSFVLEITCNTFYLFGDTWKCRIKANSNYWLTPLLFLLFKLNDNTKLGLKLKFLVYKKASLKYCYICAYVHENIVQICILIVWYHWRWETHESLADGCVFCLVLVKAILRFDVLL